ncbi:GNAT family N-acetyltransferase [Flindersiella endophytica]
MTHTEAALSGLTKLDPSDDQAIADLHAMHLAVQPVDWPWGPEPMLSHLAGSIRHGWDGETSDRWLLRDDSGAVIGSLEVNLPERENLHRFGLGVLVRPDQRGNGIGTRLYEAGLELARQSGRRLLGAWSHDAAHSMAFAEKHGFRQVAVFVHRRQNFEDVDWDLVESLRQRAIEAASDYRLLRFVGSVPDDLVDQVAVMASAINDAPTDDMDVDDDVIDAARVRAYENAQAACNQTLYRLIAQRKSDGELAGNTAIAVPRDRPEWADQHDTSVVAAHRGHRLGLLLKAEMLKWLAEAEPEVRHVDTGNAESNNYMISINEQLGYRIASRGIVWEKELA